MAIAKHPIWLLLILGLGTLLRFWNLDLKPLWMDEVITALFSMGRNYYEVPLDQALPVAQFEQVFRLNPATTCAQIASTIATQSVHPPLFFCWLHQWLGWLDSVPVAWVWKIRAFPAAIGVMAISATAVLNRTAFSQRAAWIGATLMAVSPFAVYLSQEARHYTLPMLLVLLALTGLYHLLTDLRDRHAGTGNTAPPWMWLGWIAVNGLGFYVHYFFLLAVVAQALILLGYSLWLPLMGHRATTSPPPSVDSPPSGMIEFRSLRTSPNWRAVLKFGGWWRSLLAVGTIGLLYVPWLPTLISHLSRPETDWVKGKAPGILALFSPLLQLVSGWVLTVVALPVEQQPLAIAILSGVGMTLTAIAVAWRVGVGAIQLWREASTRLGLLLLGGFCVIVMGEFLVIAYGLGKDFTQVPRYNFIYFPALCALMGASLSIPVPHRSTAQTPARSRWVMPRWIRRDRVTLPLVLGIATFSSVLVITNQVFHKPYQPERVASTLLRSPDTALLVTSAYNDFQDIALGLSFALELHQQSPAQSRPSAPQFAFLNQMNGYNPLWSDLATLPLTLPFPLDLWVIAPGLKRVGYPDQLQLHNQQGQPHTCAIAPDQHYRIGIPYQLYRCP